MSKKIFALTNLLVVVLLVAAGCTPAATAQPTQPANTVAPATQAPAPQATQPPAPQAASGQAALPDATGKRIAVIWGSLGNDFNVKVHDAAVAALKAMGANIAVDTQAGGDRNVQVSMIENAITLKVDGMIMCDVATEIIDPVIKQATDAGIPVVTVGAFSNAATNDVRNNEWMNGWDSALLLTKYLVGKPGNAVVAFEPGFMPIEVRFASLGAAMPFLVPTYKVLATVKAAWPNTIPEAKSQMEAILNQYPKDGDINVVFGTYDLETLGMAQAIEESKRDIPVIGVDCSADVLKDMKTPGSAIKGCVASDPTGMGKQGAANLVNILHGQKLPQATWFQVIPVDLDSISTYQP